MFHLQHDQRRTQHLNAPYPSAPQAPELTERDLEMLQELAELGMILARLAVNEAQRDETTETPRPRRADPRLTFLRLANATRDTIILKTRIKAGILPPAPRAPREPKAQPIAAQTTQKDPRRPLILRYFREGIDLTRQKSKIATSQHIVETHIDAELANDPHHRRPGREILLKICKSLDLPFYASRMPSDLLLPRQISKAA